MGLHIKGDIFVCRARYQELIGEWQKDVQGL